MSHLSEDDVWDKLLNPYEYSLEAGRKEGVIAGLESGFKEGMKIGHLTALDFGIELGFIQGVVSKIMDTIDTLRIIKKWDDRYHQRVIHRLRELNDLVHSFPVPSVIFASQNNNTSIDEACMDNTSLKTNAEEDSDQLLVISKRPKHRDPMQRNIDISTEMENIRYRYKMLLAQIHAPELNLQTLMDRTLNPISDSKSGSILYDDW